MDRYHSPAAVHVGGDGQLVVTHHEVLAKVGMHIYICMYAYMPWVSNTVRDAWVSNTLMGE